MSNKDNQNRPQGQQQNPNKPSGQPYPNKKEKEDERGKGGKQW